LVDTVYCLCSLLYACSFSAQRIAAQGLLRYNSQTNKSSSQRFVQVLSSGREYKKMGMCPFFFW
ncbi:MAG: hypothetical protein ACXWU7_16670, partial [Telluria sp.]